MSTVSLCLGNAHIFNTILLLVSLLMSLYSGQCTQQSSVVHLGEHKLVNNMKGLMGFENRAVSTFIHQLRILPFL